VQQMHKRHETATLRYQARIVEWNQEQARRKRQGKSLQTAREFLSFLGVL